MPRGCTNQDFLDCGPPGLDGQGGALAYHEWISRNEVIIRLSECTPDQRVRYVSSTFSGAALSWWKEMVRSMGRDTAMRMSWDEFRMLTKEKFYPEHERLKMENELRSLKMIGNDHVLYTKRFRELSRLVPHLATPVSKQIERYIQGLGSQVQGAVASVQHETLDSAIMATRILMDGIETDTSSAVNKRDKEKIYDYGKPYSGDGRARTWRRNGKFSPRCAKCTLRHREAALCPNCYRCNRLGHLANGCREETRLEAPVRVKDPMVNRIACFDCGSQDHPRGACSRQSESSDPHTEYASEPIWGWTHVTEPDGSRREISILSMVDEHVDVWTNT